MPKPFLRKLSFYYTKKHGQERFVDSINCCITWLKMVTTDADFNHLNQVFIEVEYIKPEVMK